MTTSPWIDLSAHNLALWRVGADQDGLRLYALRPIFPNLPHDFVDLETSAGQRFVWDDQVKAYVLRLRVGEEKLPSMSSWLQAYPRARQRNRQPWTFPIHQADFSSLDALPAAHPWLWSNEDHLQRCYVNEDVAIEDGASATARLRKAEEIDAGMVYPILDPQGLQPNGRALMATADPEEKSPQAQTTSQESFSIETDETSILSGETAQNENSMLPEQQRREDYGEFVAGARKHAERPQPWIESLRARQAAAQNGILTLEAARSMASTLRKKNLPDLADIENKLQSSPLLAALWKVVDANIPASVASLPMVRYRHVRVAVEPQFYIDRAMGYAEVVSAIGRKMVSIAQRNHPEDLRDALFGDAMFAPAVQERRKIIPKDPSLQRFMKGSSEYFTFDDFSDEKLEALRAMLDHKATSLVVLLSEVTTKPVSVLRETLVKAFLSAAFNAPHTRDARADQEIEELVRLYEKAEFANRRYYIDGYLDVVKDPTHTLLRNPDYLHRHGIDPRTLPSLPMDEKMNILLGYIQEKAQSMSRTFSDAMNGLFYGDSMDTTNLALAIEIETFSPKLFEQSALYREYKNAQFQFLTRLTEWVQNHAQQSLKTQTEAQTAREAAEKNDESQNGLQHDEPAFFHWKDDHRLFLPVETARNAYRSGPPTRRGNKDVTEKELCDCFGLRAVQYGNWMTQKDRQEHLNAAFDSLWDLHEWLGFERPDMVGLPRLREDGSRQKLALALGARGRGGRAVAHYEATHHVINLTKTAGVGALLHEWMHAVDAFAGAESTGGKDFMQSDLSAMSWEQTPISLFARTVMYGESTSLVKSAHQALPMLVRDANAEMKKIIYKAFLGENVQKFMFMSLYGNFRSTIFSQQKPQSLDDIEAVNRAAREKAVTLFESVLPDMVRWVESHTQKLDEVVSQDKENLGHFQTSKTKKFLMENFFSPFYTLHGRIATHENLAAENVLRQAFGLPPAMNETLDDKAIEALREENGRAMAAFYWLQACVDGGLWKHLSGPIINNDTPYDKIALKTSKNSTSFYLHAQRLGDPWRSAREMIARAVEAIGYDELAARGIRNTYLTASEPRRFSDTSYRADSEPQGEERAAFARVFNKNVVPALQNMLRKAVEEDETQESADDRKKWAQVSNDTRPALQWQTW